MAKRIKAEKIYNNNSFSSSEMFQWLRSGLRKMSMRWKPIAQVRKDAQVSYKGDNKRRKYSYVCSICKQEYDAKSCAVHHLKEVGTLKSFEDLGEFAKNLFCEKDSLILCCHTCHSSLHSKNKEDES